MAHTRRTLQLTNKWDVTLDGVGRISLVGEDLATAQGVANEARLFTEDAYFIQDQGIPHFLVDLGQRVNNSVLRSYLRQAALRVPDVKEILSIDIISFDPATRKLTGNIQYTTVEGITNGTVATYF